MPQVQHPTIERAVYDVTDEERQSWIDAGYKPYPAEDTESEAEPGTDAVPADPGPVLTDTAGSDNPPATPTTTGTEPAQTPAPADKTAAPTTGKKA